MDEHITPRSTYFVIFLALIVLLAATVGVAFIDIGPVNIILTLAIASIKALLVVLYFMHVIDSGPLTKLFVGAGLLWFLILAGLTLTDYLTRGWL